MSRKSGYRLRRNDMRQKKDLKRRTRFQMTALRLRKKGRFDQ